ncbi:MAG: ATP-binding protein [Gemmatimonadaceae bacterium]
MLQSAATIAAPVATPELDAAILQGVVTVGVAAGAFYLHRRYGKAYFGWFAVAAALYATRIAVICAFLVSASPSWLYWHQVATGWTALALLWTAIDFARQPVFRTRYLLALAFPLGWSYVAVYQLDNFMLAALPAVLFLSGVTLGTAWVFERHGKRIGSKPARFLALTLALWALHHLDYPFLRSRGAWNPWGYYIDIVLLLITTAALAALVLEDLQRGMNALMSLAPSPAPSDSAEMDDEAVLLARALALPGARGSALVTQQSGALSVVRGAGSLAHWERTSVPHKAAHTIGAAVRDGRPRVAHDWPAQGDGDAGGATFAFGAVLPIAAAHAAPAALILVGDARDPFAALDEHYLVALGKQIGGALESRALVDSLRARTDELARLAARTVGQHEEERRRLSLELHDETAQVLAAAKLRLGLMRERADGVMAAQLGQLVELVESGMRSIRSVTESLRPAVLEELGVGAAIRSLAGDFSQRTGIATSFSGSDVSLSRDAELVLYRAVQESLANVARHAGARHVRLELAEAGGAVHLAVRDDGRGLPADFDEERLALNGHAGLAGIRERVRALGGALSVSRGAGGGAHVEVEVPRGA